MTCYVLTGTPGSGKSVHMAKEIYWALKHKRPVVANFEIDKSMFRDSNLFEYVDNSRLEPKFLEEMASCYFKKHKFQEGKIKLFIDEAQIIFSNRDWQRNKEWVRFFTLHRKMGYDCFIVCQHREMIDKQIRAVLEYEVIHRKVNNVGLFGGILSLFTFGHPVFVAVTYWMGQQMRLHADWFVGRKKYYRLYDSYKVFRSAQEAALANLGGGGDLAPTYF